MKRERVAAWIDEDDAQINELMKSSSLFSRRKTGEDHTVSLRTRFQYVYFISINNIYSRSVYGTQEWARKRDEELQDEESSDFESFLASTSVSHAITKFHRSDVQFRRRQDLNIDAKGTCGAIQSLSWQKLGCRSIDSDPLIAFTAKKDKEVRICRIIDNGKSSKIEYSLKMDKWLTPGVIKFISPEELLVTNHRQSSSRVLIYNVERGKTNFFTNLGGKDLTQSRFIESIDRQFTVAFEGGNLATIDSRSKELVSELRLNNSCVGMGWTKDGVSLMAGDDRANVYHFDSRMNKCITRSHLDVLSSMSSFALNSDELAACGSPFGTVDIVDIHSLSPVVAFDKLVTGVDRLAFHPIHKTMLVASSADKRNALRVYECSSGQTMPGWPSEREPIGRAMDTQFSDCGRFLAVGCLSGRVQLYAL